MNSETVWVLLIDDDEDEHLILRDMLNKISSVSYALDWVNNYAEGLKALCTGSFDVCLLDFRLGERSGLELLETAIAQHCDLPIILLTGHGDYQTDMQAMRTGASDYLVKGAFDATLLERSIRYAIETKAAQKVLRQARERSDQVVVERTSQLAVANRELEDSRARLDAILRTVPDIIYRLDPQGRITFISQAVSNFGYSPNWLLGRDIFELVHPEDLKPTRLRLTERRTRERGNLPFEIRLRYGSLDGSPEAPAPQYALFQICAEGLYTRGNGGKMHFNGTQGIARDITNLRLAELRQKRLEQQLLQARKLESIGTLAGGIAHQFNNALAVVRGNAELLDMGLGDSDRHKKYARAIHAAVDHMVRLTNQLLAYARGGKYRLSRITLVRFLEEALPLITPNLPAGIRIDTRTSNSSMYIEVDTTQLQMVLSAVLINAAEAMGGQGVIRVETGRSKAAAVDGDDPETGPFAVLRVVDRGQGMDAETKRRIFEPFFTTKLFGRGLGMAAVYGIIRNHRGWIGVDSKPGKGTTVRLFLPISQAPKPADSPSDRIPVSRTEAEDAK